MMSRSRQWGSIGKVPAAAVLLVLVLGVPVAATIAVQNFLTADVEVADACFNKTAGADVASGTGFLTFDSTTTVSDGGVDLIQEHVTIRAFAGDRLLYTDALHFNNDCGSELTLQLDVQPDPANNPALDPASGGIWDNIDLAFYVEDPAGSAVPGLSGVFTKLLEISGGIASTSNSVTIPDGASATMAIVIDTDGNATTNDTGTLRWIALADHS